MPMSRPRAIVLSLLTAAAPALAQPRDPAAADALFREGRALLKQKKFDAACPKLAESFRLDPAPGTLFNLAQCEEGRGHIASAHERWQHLVDTLTTSGKLADDRLPVARERVAALAPRVPKLTIRIKKSAPSGTVVLRDGIELRGAGLDAPLPVDPGEHVIIARAAYRKDAETKVTLAPGDARTVEVEPGGEDGTRPAPAAGAEAPPAASAPAASASPPPSSTTLAASGGRRSTGYVFAGVGVLGLVGAGVTGLMLSSTQATVSDHCNKQTRICDQQGVDATNSGKTLLKVNAALWAVGLVGAGVGTYLILSQDSSGEPRTSLGVHAGPGVASLSFRGAL